MIVKWRKWILLCRHSNTTHCWLADGRPAWLRAEPRSAVSPAPSLAPRCWTVTMTLSVALSHWVIGSFRDLGIQALRLGRYLILFQKTCQIKNTISKKIIFVGEIIAVIFILLFSFNNIIINCCYYYYYYGKVYYYELICVRKKRWALFKFPTWVTLLYQKPNGKVLYYWKTWITMRFYETYCEVSCISQGNKNVLANGAF